MLAVLATTLFMGSTASPTIVITGATGRTGAPVYLALKAQGVNVRGVLRNVEKAKKLLGCDKCDESEGIFVADVRNAKSMASAMAGADSLIITTGPAYKCQIPSIYWNCTYYEGAEPYNMSWLGVKAQVTAFASSSGPALKDRQVVLLSNTLTTVPDNYLDKVGDGYGCFYGLQGEAFTMGSGVPYTIIKASGLSDGDPAKLEIMVAHDDQGWNSMNPDYAFIRRSDIARLLTYAVLNPKETRGLRFDLTSKRLFGKPTTDVSVAFQKAMYSWDPRKPEVEVVV